MAKKDNGNISIANVLALVGLAGVGVLTFFGILLHSDGKPGGAILGAAALVAGLGFLLVMAIKAKGAEDNPDKWRYVEWACLAVYVVVAVAFAQPFQRFFYIIGEKDTMQQMARQEAEAIKTMYQNYEHQQTTAIDRAREQMQNYLDNGQHNQQLKDALYDYMEGVGSNVDSWASKAAKATALPKDEMLIDIENDIDAWSLMQLGSLAANLEERDSMAWAATERFIAEYGKQNKLIPVIGGGSHGMRYSLDGLYTFDLGQQPEARFAATLRQSDGNTPLGWIIYIVLHLLVLLNYAVASRSVTIGPGGGRHTSSDHDL